MSTHLPLIGSLAPPFQLACTPLPGTGRRQVALSDFQGRWLCLVFYPRDFSMVCPTELASLSQRIGEFHEHGCELLGISCDSLESHEEWIQTPRERGGLPGLSFPLASDPDGTVARAYGVYLEYQRVALRGLFVIDPNGVLQYLAVHNTSVGRRTDDILRVLSALQTGGLCAENWKTPEDTIDPTTRLMPNVVVSHYRIEEVIGTGSFATVYRARDLRLDRSVALKVFNRGGPMTASTVLAEARFAAALNHPNVCTIFEVDDSTGVPAIAMEYVPGRTLSHLMSRSRLAADQTSSIGRQIATGMAAAHAHGIVHGDLKPENIIVAENEVVKILDFGLSRRTRRSVSVDETIALGVAEGSDPGGLFGTPSYLAPEQTFGEPATEASDLFAVGLILYEMLTGQKAFIGSTILEVIGRIRDVNPESLASGVDEPFASILRMSLQPDPAGRSLGMETIASALSA